jgi:DNA polymerase III gamma/tau subunit
VETAALKEQSPLANTGSLTRILETLTEAELRLRDTASKKILVEVTLLKAIEASKAVSLDSVLKQLNQLRGGQGSAGSLLAASTAGTPATAPTARSTAKSTSTHQAVTVPVAPVAAAVAAPAAGDLAGLWTALIEAVGRVSPFTRSYLVDAHPVSFDKGILTIGFDPEFEDHLGLVDNARNHTLLQTKLAELGHANAQINFIKAEAPVGTAKPAARVPVISAPAAPAPVAAKPAASAPPTPTKEKIAPVAFNKNDFKNDPLIQKALEIFKGQIIEVRA